MRHKLIVALAALAAFALAGAAKAVTINFEANSNLEILDNQYNGIGADFNGQARVLKALSAGGSLNDGGYPLHSGTNAIDSPVSGSIRIDAVGGTWSAASIWGIYSDAAGATGLYLDAYNAANVVIATNSFSPTNYGGPAKLLSVAAPNIAYVIFHDSGGYFTGDDFSYTPAAVVPLPAAAWLGFALVGSIGAARLRRRYTPAIA